MAIILSSAAFAGGERIPKKYTGDGLDVSPPLSWSGLPSHTRELALICEDPDVRMGEAWVHWVLYKIPVTLEGIPEGLAKIARLRAPCGLLQGKNSWNAGVTIGYRGPMPPPDHGEHRYFFRLYALEGKLVVEPGLTKTRLMGEMNNHILAEGQLMGTYQR
jgi:Raf kinase inhibitor-like YbhB/YbcL family protein